MIRRFSAVPPLARAVVVGRGEKVLAGALTLDGLPVAGTRLALYLPEGRIPWEQVQHADWDPDEGMFRVSEVGEFGQQRRVHEMRIDQPGRLLEFVRERVTSTVLVQRHVPVYDRKGVFVIGRRPASGTGPIVWLVEFEAGIDPNDPEVRRAAVEGLERAKNEVG